MIEPFGIRPDYDLNLMKAGQTLTDINVRVLQGLTPVLEEVKPDILLVQGDTATVFLSSLAAFYSQIKVGHVEAGLRSFDKYRPYPEEINRKLTTVLADFHFAPTELSRQNLLKENVPDKSIFVTGNTAIDMLKHTASKGEKFNNHAVEGVDFSNRVILMTAHRRENWGQPMQNICRAVKKIVGEFPDIFVVWAVHPGKAAHDPPHEILGGTERVLLTPPLDIFDMHNLMRRAYLMLTDSGGLQEESPSFDLPTIVLRDVTERPEGLTAGTLTLAGTTEESIYNETKRILTDSEAYEKMAAAKNPFGDGNASKRIIEAIVRGDL
jgi:UDP-N-acetylglucosamine 2-epimerase (non-hydrolysing)